LTSFGAGLAGVLSVLAVLRLLHAGLGRSWWLFCAAAVVAVAALLLPSALRPLYHASRKTGFALGWLSTQLLLTVVYYLVVTPIALALRLLGRDPLKRRPEPTRTSYWQAPEHRLGSDQYWQRQF
jgi:voltage-gated potassium channel Kch